MSSGGLNIAAVARRTGVGEHTLRKWEERYGVPRPTRTVGGQRRYASAGGAPPGTAEELRDAIIAAAAHEGRDALEALLDYARALYPLEAALREIISPCLGDSRAAVPAFRAASR